jgi:hypothetical protein
MRLPGLITDQDELVLKPKIDDDQMMGRMDEDQKPKGKGIAGKPILADIDWKNYLKAFESVPREKLVGSLNEVLLQVPPSFSQDVIRHYADAQSRESFIRSATIQIMSTPEYQLC